jgi:hypothetical protein
MTSPMAGGFIIMEDADTVYLGAQVACRPETELVAGSSRPSSCGRQHGRRRKARRSRARQIRDFLPIG